MLTVIVPARNAEEHLDQQLWALANQVSRARWELLVIDHRSTDRTGDVAREIVGQLSHAQVVRLDEGDNLSAARNRGVELAAGTAVAFCDADDVVHPNWVDAISEALEKHPLVVGKLDHTSLNTPSGLYRSHQQALSPDQLFGAPTVIGASFGFQRWVWDFLGGFDESFDKAEDTEFGVRAFLELGVTPHFAERAVTSYRYRTDVRGIWRQGVAGGEIQPRLIKQYADRLPNKPRRVRLAAARYAKIIRALPGALLADGGTLILIYRVAYAYGRIRGSIRYRYLYL